MRKVFVVSMLLISSFCMSQQIPFGFMGSHTVLFTPNSPILALPVTNAVNQVEPVTFDWSDVTDADYYNLQVSSGITFSATVINQSAITNSYYSQAGDINTLLDNTKYYWRVSATNIVGTSAWSGVDSFTMASSVPLAPSTVSPTSNQTGVAILPTLDWTDASGALTYKVQVSTSIGFGSLVVNQTGLALSTYTIPSQLIVATKYYWRALGTNGVGDGSWSNIDSFTTFIPSAPSIAYSLKPEDLQLYPRDADDSATVILSGRLSSIGYDSIYVELYKNGSLLNRSSNALVYAGSTADFYLSRRIHAELSEYKILLYTKYNATSVLARTTDSIVCGDVYIIAGQSNGQNPDLNVTTNDQYCRTYGVQTDSLNLSAYSAGDTLWQRSSANYDDFAIYPRGNYPRNVGVIGMTLQKYIRDSCSVPTCIINGTEQGTSIITHQRNNSNPMELSRTTLYGRTLYRATKSGVASKVKAIIWYQGERDLDIASGTLYNNPKGVSGYSTYANKFDSLYNSWKSDYTGLQKIYVMQVRPLSCGSSGYAQELRETQRQLQTTYSDVQVIATLGVKGYLDCHYDYTGYQYMTLALFKNIGIKFYPTNNVAMYDTLYNRPPSINRAFYTNSAKTQIGMTFNNSNPKEVPADTTVNGNTLSIKKYFYLNKVRTATTVTSVTLSSGKDTMYLNLGAASSASRLAYIPNSTDEFGNVYNGAFIRNSRGLAMLSFDNVPIYEYESGLLFSRMITAGSTGLTRTREILCDSLIKRLKANNVFTGDALYIYANSDSVSANINWLNDSLTSSRRGIRLPVFTADRGYQGVRLDSGYLTTKIIPSISCSYFKQDSGAVAVYNAVEYTLDTFGVYVGEGRPFGAKGTTTSYVGMVLRTFYSGGNKFFTNVNDVATSLIVTSSSSKGLFVSNRRSVDTVIAYRNGSQLYSNVAQTPTFLNSTRPIYVGAYNTDGTATNFFAGRYQMFRIGGRWTPTQATAFSTDIEWYMLQIGASYTQ